MRATLLSLVLLIGAIAGCVSKPADDGAQTEDSDVPDRQRALLGDHPIPRPDGNRTHDWLATFCNEHAPRITGTPQEEAAAADIIGVLEDAGYEVETLRFDASLPLVGNPAGGEPSETGRLKAILATRAGTTQPDRWLAWGGHYDTAAFANEPGVVTNACYDNGSGTAATIEIARTLAAYETNHTLAAILFNGEEEGVLASGAYTSWYNSSDTGYTIDLFIGLDMVGIAHPAPGRSLSVFMGPQFSDPLFDTTVTMGRDVLGFPYEKDRFVVHSDNTRNSDEATFAAIGVPTLRLAGMETAGEYWGYHRANDTMETIYAMSGPTPEEGKANFSDGLANSAQLTASMVLALDRMAPLEAPQA